MVVLDIPENSMKKLIILLLSFISISVCYGNNFYNDSIMKEICAQDAIKDSTIQHKIDYAFSELIKDCILDNPLNIQQYDYLSRNYDKLDKKDLALYFYLSYNYYIEEKDAKYSIAEYFLTQAVNYDPTNKVYIKKLIQLLLSFKDYKATKKYCNKLLKLEQDKTIAYNYLFINSAQVEKFNEAKKYINKIYEVTQDKYEYLESMVYVYKLEKNWDGAIDFINSFINKYPETKPIAITYISDIYSINGKYNLAIETLNNNKDIIDSTMLYYYLANNYKHLDNDSLFAYYTIKTINGSNMDFSDLESNIRSTVAYYNQTNQKDKIYPIIDLLTDNFNTSHKMLLLKADIYKILNDSVNMNKTIESLVYDDNYYDQKLASDYYTIMATNKVDNSVIKDFCLKNYKKYDNDVWFFQYFLLTVADTTISLSAINDTVNFYINQIDDKNSKANIYDIYSSVLMTRNADYNKILNAIDSSLKYNPNNALTLNNKAYYLSIDSTKLNEAEKIAQKAIEMDPNQISCIDTYAWILYLQKNYFLSNIYFDKIHRLLTDSSRNEVDCIVLYYHHGKVYFALNMNTEAEELWNRIINIFNSLNDSQKENLNMEVKNAIIEIQQYFNDKHEK